MGSCSSKPIGAVADVPSDRPGNFPPIGDSSAPKMQQLSAEQQVQKSRGGRRGEAAQPRPPQQVLVPSARRPPVSGSPPRAGGVEGGGVDLTGDEGSASSNLPRSRPPSASSIGGGWVPKSLRIPRVLSSNRIAGGGGGGTGLSEVPAGMRFATPVPYVQDPSWEALVRSHEANISDPADVPSVLDELVSATVDLLTPSEITLVQRRIRDAVRSVGGGSSAGSKVKPSKLGSRTKGGSRGGTDWEDAPLVPAAADERSRNVCRMENGLDLNLVRKVFAGGERMLDRVYEEDIARTSRSVYVQRKGEAMSKLSAPAAGWAANGRADMIGSAHVLMRHLSEKRWERVATVAALSASRAKLELDINKRGVRSGSKLDGSGNSLRELHPYPAPQPATPEAYGVDPNELSPSSVQPLPSGVSLASVCYLISSALRGTRFQRLTLLYYLLLPADQLRDLLDGHCAGGVPTWLLESGARGSIVSYASLSHYYYYGGRLADDGNTAMNYNAANTASASSPKPKPSSRRLVLSAPRAIGAIASLLMDSLGATGKSNGAEAVETSVVDLTDSRSSVSKGLTEDRDTKKPKSFRRGLSTKDKEAIMDGFWSNSHSLYDNPDTSGVCWTPDEFHEWAERALCGKGSQSSVGDLVLDMITHRLFGTGILPTPNIERTIVSNAWVQWQSLDGKVCSGMKKARGWDSLSIGSKRSDNASPESPLLAPSSLPWGGLGGIDGWGGLGFGILYCIDRKWWDEWAAYVGWTWGDADIHPLVSKSKRPSEIATDSLLANKASTWGSSLPGEMGSFEPMLPNLVRGRDYALVPPPIWDIFYEIYGGGPPLPRMVSPPGEESGLSLSGQTEFSGSKDSRPTKIPPHVSVETNPWVIHCNICDPYQPYRRGDAGPLSIRVMAAPEQTLWRLLGEIVARLPVRHQKARDASGLGRARLWIRADDVSAPGANGGDNDTSPGGGRYGPWTLLCKNGFASIPVGDSAAPSTYDSIEFMTLDWLDYTQKSTVESAGLSDGCRLMFEYALVAKDGTFAWPREAAAKAGRVRRLADEDAAFRLELRGLDAEGKPRLGRHSLIKKSIDAMNVSGRWFKTEILEVDNRGDTDDEDEDNDVASSEKEQNEGGNHFIPGEIRSVRVDFTPFGGHEEWIDVRSDRLASAGRLSIPSVDEPNPEDANDANSLSEAQGAKKPGPNQLSKDLAAGKGCPFPGYGACGLSNIGNTCYANSALQCISYIPLLRSYFISGQYKINGDLNKTNFLGTGGKVLEEFADLLRLMYSGKFEFRAPMKLKGQLSKARSQYSGADQQDAQEFLNDMFDCLHEDSNKVIKKPYVEASEDEWVERTGLPRVGLEAWRRFLRRNRSVIADVAMGQVLNRVMCPKCKYESRNFDPFNMLSVPFPTVAEVVFRCRVVRRGTSLNCPDTLGRRKENNGDQVVRKTALPSPPSGRLIVEEYILPMSRLADVGDLKLRLQNMSGIPSSNLRLCKREEIVNNSAAPIDRNDPTRTYTKVTALGDIDGPCIEIARKLSAGKAQEGEGDANASSPTIAEIMAFESTLRLRPSTSDNEDSDYNGSNLSPDMTDEETDEEDANISQTDAVAGLEKVLDLYGDEDECRLYDTDPLLVAKAISRNRWPKAAGEFKLGLRVDAIDNRNNWCSGSVVEIIEGSDDQNQNLSEDKKGNGNDGETKVRIHFDNFSSKWDETYTIHQFKKGRVRPLLSHANPKKKPAEFMVHHRHESTNGNSLFGQTFYVQCHNESSTARAGAQILAQASRFLQDREDQRREPIDKFYTTSQKARLVIVQIIELLVESDRKFVQAALKSAKGGNGGASSVSSLTLKLQKKLSILLPMLPFDIRVCTVDSPLGSKQGESSEEVSFPFTLVRSIGNYMNARHAIILHWHNGPLSKKANRSIQLLLYMEPILGVHERSKDAHDAYQAANEGGKKGAQGDLQLGACLDEFCKEQHLPETDNWRCSKCKEVREGKQHMILWKLPDILVFHLKRFNCSARWREKITSKVNFPLTGLDMTEWCDIESGATDESSVYDLIGVMNHYGGMTGGHYVATCKATACGTDGREEAAYNFNGNGVSEVGAEAESAPSMWKLGRTKEKGSASASSKAATAATRNVSESAEPLWLQFDDDLVDPIPPKHVVSEMAYVLFYRRRRISPSNIAKYSTLE